MSAALEFDLEAHRRAKYREQPVTFSEEVRDERFRIIADAFLGVLHHERGFSNHLQQCGITAVIIYGSWVRNFVGPHPLSDIDILLYSKVGWIAQETIVHFARFVTNRIISENFYHTVAIDKHAITADDLVSIANRTYPLTVPGYCVITRDDYVKSFFSNDVMYQESV